VSGSLLPTIQGTANRLTVGAGLFAEADYYPVPSWEHVRQPVLAVWGVYDADCPPEESAGIIRQALEHGANAHYTIRFFPHARHDLHVTADQGFDPGSYAGGFAQRSALAPGYADLVTSWINGLARALPAASAEPAPHQERQSIALAPLAWYESPWMQLGAMALFLAAFAGNLVAEGMRRILRRCARPPVRRATWLLAAAGLASVLGSFAYVLLLVGTAAEAPGPVIAGRPLPWLVLQLLALVVVGSTVATALSWWLARRVVRPGMGAQLGLLLAGGLLYVPWAVYWGLLRP
jgi:uncharacterized protein